MWLGLGEVDVAQAEPLADEVLGERRRLRVLEHPLDLPAQRVRLAQLPLLGQGEQLLVGHRAPQEVRQPAGQGEVVELAGLLAEEQEVRRHHHAQQADADRLLERVLLGQLRLDEVDERLDVVVASRVRRKARRAKSRRMRSASASGSFETTSTRLREL